MNQCSSLCSTAVACGSIVLTSAAVCSHPLPVFAICPSCCHKAFTHEAALLEEDGASTRGFPHSIYHNTTNQSIRSTVPSTPHNPVLNTLQGVGRVIVLGPALLALELWHIVLGDVTSFMVACIAGCRASYRYVPRFSHIRLLIELRRFRTFLLRKNRTGVAANRTQTVNRVYRIRHVVARGETVIYVGCYRR
jgi:hypothetical protein